MEQQTKQSKLWFLLGAAALIILLLAVVLFTQSVQQKQEQSIVLPELRQSDPVSEPVGSDFSFAEVSAKNVQQVIETLQRPDCYHQVLTLTTETFPESTDANAELWRCGRLLRAEITQNGVTQTLLTDGSVFYLWYDGDRTAARVEAPDATADELIGLPTYEVILSLAPEKIREASFVSLQEPEAQSCVFVDCEHDGLQQYYWIGLQSGLLFRQTTLQHSQPIFSAQQTLLEPLGENDAVFSDRFLLPDGTAPFSTAG